MRMNKATITILICFVCLAVLSALMQKEADCVPAHDKQVKLLRYLVKEDGAHVLQQYVCGFPATPDNFTGYVTTYKSCWWEDVPYYTPVNIGIGMETMTEDLEVINEHGVEGKLCKQCVEDGKKSRIRIAKTSRTLLYCGDGHYDEDGVFHPPPPPPCNKTTITYRCSNNHIWDETE